MASEHYELLIERARDVGLIGSAAAVLHWDQETMMAAGGTEHRARQLARLAELTHERATAPEIGEWLAACEGDRELTADPLAVSAVNLRELRRDYDRATKLPTTLVARMAEVTSLAQRAWAEAREASDFGQFRPWLEQLLDLSRQRAACLGATAGKVFDTLLEDYEPGATGDELSALFDPMRPRLSALVSDLQERGTAPSGRLIALELPVEAQEAFVRHVVATLGFDFERGRLDRSTHPFSIGLHPTDVRITTRFAKDNVLDALGSTMHEAGHGMYEQGLLAEHFGTPMGSAVSLGIHESQSRLWENQVGRSWAFWRWCHPLLARFFGSAVHDVSLEAAFGAANLVRPSLIRVEADEATYNLHVMVRFEIERALLDGGLDVADLPATWNRAYRDVIGVVVPDDRRGCLQDVHWSCGMFGYFPTYTLGNLYAAQFFAAARRAVPDLEDQFAAGEFGALRRWLNEHVHAPGQRFRAADLVQAVCGEPLSAEPFLAALEDKLHRVYGR